MSQLVTVDRDRRVVANRAVQREVAFASGDRYLTNVRPLKTPDHFENADRTAPKPEQHVRCRLDLRGIPEEVVELSAGDVRDLAAGPEQERFNVIDAVAVQGAATRVGPL